MDEICYADEIKSVLYSNEVGFHHEGISSIKDGFIPSVVTVFLATNEYFDTGCIGLQKLHF